MKHEERLKRIVALQAALIRYRNFYFMLGFTVGAFVGMAVTLLVS